MLSIASVVYEVLLVIEIQIKFIGNQLDNGTLN